MCCKKNRICNFFTLDLLGVVRSGAERDELQLTDSAQFHSGGSGGGRNLLTVWNWKGSETLSSLSKAAKTVKKKKLS